MAWFVRPCGAGRARGRPRGREGGLRREAQCRPGRPPARASKPSRTPPQRRGGRLPPGARCRRATGRCREPASRSCRRAGEALRRGDDGYDDLELARSLAPHLSPRRASLELRSCTPPGFGHRRCHCAAQMFTKTSTMARFFGVWVYPTRESGRVGWVGVESPSLGRPGKGDQMARAGRCISLFPIAAVIPRLGLMVVAADRQPIGQGTRAALLWISAIALAVLVGSAEVYLGLAVVSRRHKGLAVFLVSDAELRSILRKGRRDNWAASRVSASRFRAPVFGARKHSWLLFAVGLQGAERVEPSLRRDQISEIPGTREFGFAWGTMRNFLQPSLHRLTRRMFKS
jgi:hypothetical protein